MALGAANPESRLAHCPQDLIELWAVASRPSTQTLGAFPTVARAAQVVWADRMSRRSINEAPLIRRPRAMLGAAANVIRAVVLSDEFAAETAQAANNSDVLREQRRVRQIWAMAVHQSRRRYPACRLQCPHNIPLLTLLDSEQLAYARRGDAELRMQDGGRRWLGYAVRQLQRVMT